MCHEFILPIIKFFLMPLVAVFIGAKLAFGNLRNKERMDLESDRYDCSVKWLLEASECLNTLCELKKSYITVQERDDLFRSIGWRRPGYELERANISGIEKLYFLNNENIEIERLGFRNYYRVKHLFNSYNQVITAWNQMDQMKSEIDMFISNHIREEGGFEVSHELIDEISPIKLINYLLLSEKTYSLINDLLNDFYKFAQDFPVIVNEVIDLKIVFRNKLLSFSPSDEYLKIIMLNCNKLSDNQLKEIKDIAPNHKKWQSNKS